MTDLTIGYEAGLNVLVMLCLSEACCFSQRLGGVDSWRVMALGAQRAAAGATQPAYIRRQPVTANPF